MILYAGGDSTLSIVREMENRDFLREATEDRPSAAFPLFPKLSPVGDRSMYPCTTQYVFTVTLDGLGRSHPVSREENELKLKLESSSNCSANESYFGNEAQATSRSLGGWRAWIW